MVIVEPQVTHTVLDQPPPPAEDVGFVRLHDLAHEALWHFVLGLLQMLLDRLAEVGHATRGGPGARVRTLKGIRVHSDEGPGVGPHILFSVLEARAPGDGVASLALHAVLPLEFSVKLVFFDFRHDPNDLDVHCKRELWTVRSSGQISPWADHKNYGVPRTAHF